VGASQKKTSQGIEESEESAINGPREKGFQKLALLSFCSMCIQKPEKFIRFGLGVVLAEERGHDRRLGPAMRDIRREELKELKSWGGTAMKKGGWGKRMRQSVLGRRA